MEATPRITAHVVLMAALMSGLLLAPQGAVGSVPARVSACGDVRAAFPYGVAATTAAAHRAVRAGFIRPAVKPAMYAKARARLDTDRDGLVCGVRRTSSSSASPSSPQPSPSPTPSSQEIYQAPTVSGQPVDACRVRDRSVEAVRFGNVFAGFTDYTEPVHRPGILRVALVPIDWADVPGQPDPLGRVHEQMRIFSEWYHVMSAGRIKVEWVTHDGWVRMPKTSRDYVITAAEYAGGQRGKLELGRDAFAAADAHVDFTNVDWTHFLLPRGHKVLDISMQVFPWEANGGFRTNEGIVGGYSAPGLHFDHPQRSYWSYWAHEVGHFLRIAHVGSSWNWSDMTGFDLMGSQDGPFRSLSSWLRFMKGWLSDDQVHCMTVDTLKPTQIMLAPLDSGEIGIATAIIRISDTQTVVMESRRSTAFDCPTTFPYRGVLAYLYDSRFGNQEVFFTPIVPNNRSALLTGCMAPEMRDIVLRPGDSVTQSGVRIRVVRSGTYDTVVVERAS